MGRPKTPAIQRFQIKYVISESTNCWLWSAATDRDGYGMFRGDDTKNIKAHRWSYQHHIGVLLDDTVICHTCDTPSCVNPAHLWQGTHLENEQDKDSKNRRKGAHIGEGNHTNILTEEEVIDIWHSSLSKAELGRQYGVSESAIRKIQWGHNWQHLKLGDKRNVTGKMDNR